MTQYSIIQRLEQSDDSGYIITKPDSTYTNIDGVFAEMYRMYIDKADAWFRLHGSYDAERWLESLIQFAFIFNFFEKIFGREKMAQKNVYIC